MRLGTKPPPLRQMTAASAQYRKDLRSAAVIATDRQSKDGQRAVQGKIKAVGLGRLGGAVGHTSTKREGAARAGADPYGVIFARGGDESQAGGTLEAYTRGATIVAQQARWLAIPTDAVPRFVTLGGRRFRTTPQLYMNSGLMTSIGKLQFVPLGPDRALYVIKKVSVSPKTGRAKALGKRKTRTRIPQKEVVAFILIRVTKRAQRFDQRVIMLSYARQGPQYMAAALAEIRGRRAG